MKKQKEKEEKFCCKAGCDEEFFLSDYKNAFIQIFEKQSVYEELKHFTLGKLFYHYTENHFCSMSRDELNKSLFKVMPKDTLFLDKYGNIGLKTKKIVLEEKK